MNDKNVFIIVIIIFMLLFILIFLKLNLEIREEPTSKNFASNIKKIIKKSDYDYIKNNLNLLEEEIKEELLEIENIYGVKIINGT